MASGTILDRRHLASQRPSRRTKHRIAFGLIALLSLVILGILASGYVVKFVLPPRQPVVSVGGVEYTRADMVKLLRARQATVELLGGRIDYGSDVMAALLTIVENEIISQSAHKFGISVSPQEVEREIRRNFMPADQNAEDVSRESREQYSALVNRIQLSESEHREQVRKALLREKFRQTIGESVPTVVEQVHLHRIQMRQNDEIDVVKVKLRDLLDDSSAPEDVAQAVEQVVREFSKDTQDVLRRGGDLGWVTRGIYRDHEDAFFELDVGEISQPRRAGDTQGGVYFYVVSGRQSARQLDDGQRNVLKTDALRAWLDGQRDRYDVRTSFGSDVHSWMITQLKLTTTASSAAEPQELDQLRRSLGF